MTHSGEFWLVYQFASRGNVAPTSQLIELAAAGQKLCDLEDVSEYVFRQGYVEARFRPVTTWARRDGVPVHPSDSVEELLKQGVGKCAETAIVLTVDDAPTHLWFTYYYVHSPEAKVSTQRVPLNQDIKFENIAQLTNYVFDRGYLPGQYRPFVHWETQSGKKLTEDGRIVDVSRNGFGVTDGKAIRLVIDVPGHPFYPHDPHIPRESHHHYDYDLGVPSPGTSIYPHLGMPIYGPYPGTPIYPYPGTPIYPYPGMPIYPSPGMPIYPSPGMPTGPPPSMSIHPSDRLIQPPGMSTHPLDIPIYSPDIPTYPPPRTRTVRRVPKTQATTTHPF